MGIPKIIKSLGEVIVKIIKAFSSCKCHCECCESDCQTRTAAESEPEIERNKFQTTMI